MPKKILTLCLKALLAAALPVGLRAQESEWLSYMNAAREQERAGNLSNAEKQILHAVTVVESSPALKARREFETYEALAAIFHSAGKYSEAEGIYEKLLNQKKDEALPSFGSRISALQIRLAAVRALLGRLDQAEMLLKTAIAIETGEDRGQSELRAASIRQLAEIRRIQGRYAEAESLLRREQPALEARLGTSHPMIGSYLETLADVYRDSGRYDQAQALYQQRLKTGTDRSGALLGLAAIYRAQYRWDEAERALKDGGTERERALGAKHPSLAVVWIALAAVYREQRRFPDAAALYDTAGRILDGAFEEPEHPARADLLSGQARLDAMEGRLPEAEIKFQKALRIRSTQYGPSHPQTAAVQDELGTLARAMGKHAEAERFHNEALRIQQAALGSGHPEIGKTMINLGKLAFERHRHAEAEGYYRKALAIVEKVFGADSPAVADGAEQLAVVHHAQRNYEQAERNYQLALHARLKAGIGGPAVRTLQESLADLYFEQAKWPQAEKAYSELANWQTGGKPSGKPGGKPLMRLAEIYRVTRRWSEAERIHRQLVSLHEGSPGNAAELVRLLIDLGDVCAAQGKFTEALEQYSKALKLEKESAFQAVVAAQLHCKSGQAAFSLGRLADAQTHFEQCLAIRQKQYSEADPETGEATLGLAQVLAERKDFGEAERNYLRALSIQQKRFGPDSQETAAVMLSLGVLKRAAGQLADASRFLQQSHDIQRKLNRESAMLAATLTAAAAVAVDREQFGEAETRLKEARSMLERLDGADDSRLTPVLRTYADLQRKRQDLAGAQSSLRQALAILKKSSPDALTLADIRNELALALAAGGKYAEADGLYREALNALQARGGPEEAVILANLADLYRVTKKYKEAEENFRQAKSILEAAGPASRPQLADTNEKLSKFALERGQTSEAEALARSALEIYQEKLGTSNTSSARVLAWLGRVYQEKRDYRRAGDCYQQAITMYERTLGPQTTDLIPVLEDHAAFLRLRKRDAEAASALDRARALRARLRQ